MARTDANLGYNDRLFSGKGIRDFYHRGRYAWIERKLKEHTSGPLRIVELGCFDGKLLDYVPRNVAHYVGLDANWEGGLDLGRQRFAGRTDIDLLEAHSAEVLRRYETDSFNVAVALETLEHIPHQVMIEYLDELARVTSGLIFISVPNEMGPVFLAKYISKKLRYGGGEVYTPKEVLAATLYRMHEVERDQHKGFDYRDLSRTVDQRFEVLAVEGIPFERVPPIVSLTVGIVARTRSTPASI